MHLILFYTSASIQFIYCYFLFSQISTTNLSIASNVSLALRGYSRDPTVITASQRTGMFASMMILGARKMDKACPSDFYPGVDPCGVAQADSTSLSLLLSTSVAGDCFQGTPTCVNSYTGPNCDIGM